MKKIMHYVCCLYNLMKKYLRRTINEIRQFGKRVLSILKCIYFSITKHSYELLGNEKMSDYYQNKGHLINASEDIIGECNLDLSIIVPLYNVSQYIEQCLDSILNQKTKYSYEIILVDDGSTDDTSQVIKPFLNREHIVFLQQENKGQSSARNKAISQARGQYLMFVDGDDILLADTIETLLETAISTQSDIAEGNVLRFYDRVHSDELKQSKKIVIKSDKKNPKFVLTCCGYSVAKVYKRDMWETLRYPEGYIFEDVITKFILRRKANQVAFVDMFVYGYRQNPNSSSHGSNQMKKLDSIWVYPKIVELCRQEAAPMDDVFYLLSLNHICVLNYVILCSHKEDIKKAGFLEMQKQLISIQEYRVAKLPLMFKLLEKSILDGNFENWECTAKTIVEFGLLKKWREIN